MKEPKNLRGAFLITGPSGVGKTTVARELRNMGCNVEYNSKICHFVDSSGKAAVKPWHLNDLGWLSAHSWVFNHDKLMSLIDSHNADHIFVEAVAADMGNYGAYFKSVFYLRIDDSILATRIRADSREGRYGKEDFQLKEIIDGAEKLEAWVRSVDGYVIDANQSIDRVVDDILREVRTIWLQ